VSISFSWPVGVQLKPVNWNLSLLLSLLVVIVFLLFAGVSLLHTISGNLYQLLSAVEKFHHDYEEWERDKQNRE
jgi:hypothetical protein